MRRERRPRLLLRSSEFSTVVNVLNRLADPVYCAMRLLVGLMFACWGAKLVLGMFAGNPAQLTLILRVAGWIELIGGILVAFGFLTRAAAFLASGTMAVAYFMVHAPNGFFPIVNQGEKAVFYCWIFLFMFFYGPGRWSVDAVLKSRSSGNSSSP